MFFKNTWPQTAMYVSEKNQHKTQFREGDREDKYKENRELTKEKDK